VLLLWTMAKRNLIEVRLRDRLRYLAQLKTVFRYLVGLVNQAKSSSSKGGDFMQEFFGDVEIVKANIVVIKESTRKIAEINQNVLQATTTDREQDYSHELEPLVKSTNKKATIAKQLLQRLREDTERLKTSGTGAKQTPEIRIRENLTNTLTRKFVDVMKEYQNAQTKYKTDIKKKVKRQVQIVKPDATTEEIDAVFKSGGGSGEVLKSAILTVRVERIPVFKRIRVSASAFVC
jgi:t-SNARE complex subunit (syntaxin)